MSDLERETSPDLDANPAILRFHHSALLGDLRGAKRAKRGREGERRRWLREGQERKRKKKEEVTPTPWQQSSCR